MTSKKFLCIQRSQPGESQQPSPAQMQEMYAQFNNWREKFSANIANMGGRLGGGKVATVDGVKDGPFVETKEIIGGFMIISAECIEEAVKIATECPGVVSPKSCVEVREITTP